jgi:hypothetical protein
MLAGLSIERRTALLAAADDVVKGRWRVLGVERDDLEDPDWSLDPISGRHYPVDRSAFRIDYRAVDDDRRVKQVWELSRHHHLTVLAAAWQLTGEESYAETVSTHLRSWWRRNPFLSGVNWASGIELGIRLISWVWVRRLLEGWPGAPALFEENATAVRQVYDHQRYLAAFRSRGSSANNHVIAEAAGQLAACGAFPWFDRSRQWGADASALLQRELRRNTFDSGVNREQAFEYHGLVAELGILAGAEAAAAGAPFAPATWTLLCQMLDVLAATVDETGHPPRYGDGDDGRALLLAPPEADRWGSLLAVGAAIFGPAPWWPATEPDAASLVVGSMVGRLDGGRRPTARPSHFPDAGLTVLRHDGGAGREIWCRCDGGPHGFLSIAAHAHADALSVEVRHGGVDVLVDPGTYCYQGDPAWRAYFRSTIAHNTIEVGQRDQSEAGGPFLWVRHAATRVREIDVDEQGAQSWTADHDGYGELDQPVHHRRRVTLDGPSGVLTLQDWLETQGHHPIRMALHLGPAIRSTLDGSDAILEWDTPEGVTVHAILELPGALRWSAFRGSTDPVLGWYSPAFGEKLPTTSLIGTGTLATATLTSRLSFRP